jgi:hypothetical protein
MAFSPQNCMPEWMLLVLLAFEAESRYSCDTPRKTGKHVEQEYDVGSEGAWFRKSSRHFCCACEREPEAWEFKVDSASRMCGLTMRTRRIIVVISRRTNIPEITSIRIRRLRIVRLNFSSSGFRTLGPGRGLHGIKEGRSSIPFSWDGRPAVL